jgi:hypothetical protein
LFELGKELVEVGVDGGPVGEEVAVWEARVGLEVFVGAETGFDDWDDFGRGWVWARDADLAAIAEGFEVRSLAGRIEGGEFVHGFWEGDVPGVDGAAIGGCWWLLIGRRVRVMRCHRRLDVWLG